MEQSDEYALVILAGVTSWPTSGTYRVMAPLDEDRKIGDERLLLQSVDRPELFVFIYDRYSVRLLRFFVSRTLDPTAAADLTSETVAEAFASRGRFRGGHPGAASAWLFAIATHQLNRYIRRRIVDERSRRALGLMVEPPSGADLERIEDLVDFEQTGRNVATALAALPTSQRRAVFLRVIEGKPYREVAIQLSCSEETARARVSRGIRRIAADLGPPDFASEGGSHER